MKRRRMSHIVEYRGVYRPLTRTRARKTGGSLRTGLQSSAGSLLVSTFASGNVPPWSGPFGGSGTDSVDAMFGYAGTRKSFAVQFSAWWCSMWSKRYGWSSIQFRPAPAYRIWALRHTVAIGRVCEICTDRDGIHQTETSEEAKPMSTRQSVEAIPMICVVRLN